MFGFCPVSNGVTGGFSKGGAGSNGCGKAKHSFLRISNIVGDVEAELPFGQMEPALTTGPATKDTWRGARENTASIDRSGHWVGRESPTARHRKVLGEMGRKWEGQRLQGLVVAGREAWERSGQAPHPRTSCVPQPSPKSACSSPALSK